MRRRTLLLGLAAGLTGGAAAVMGAGSADAAGRTSASAILGSTKTSTLSPRPVTPYHPVRGHAPAPVATAGRVDYAFTRGARSLPTRIWYPDGAGRYPLIVFSHGMLSQPDDYADLLTSWARAGFVVAAPLYPHTSLGTAEFNAYDVANQPADASAVLTQTLQSPLSAKIDAGRLAAAGHSAGGITTVGMFSGCRDPRLKAGVVLAGTDYLSTPFTGPAAAMLFVQGAKDDTVAWSAARTVFEAVPWSRAMLTVTDGGHQTTAAALPAVSGTSVEFLRWSLHGDAAARTRLPGAAALGGVATLDATL
jgi:dienelactone hydrolase